MGALFVAAVYLAGTFALYGVLRVVLFIDSRVRPPHGSTSQEGTVQTDSAARRQRTFSAPQAPPLNGQPAEAGARARRFVVRS
jgi:hypothetical protein